jgi:hypothetical protein
LKLVRADDVGREDPHLLQLGRDRPNQVHANHSLRASRSRRARSASPTMLQLQTGSEKQGRGIRQTFTGNIRRRTAHRFEDGCVFADSGAGRRTEATASL